MGITLIVLIGVEKAISVRGSQAVYRGEGSEHQYAFHPRFQIVVSRDLLPLLLPRWIIPWIVKEEKNPFSFKFSHVKVFYHVHEDVIGEPGTPAHGMAPPTFRMILPSVKLLWKHLTDLPRGMSPG